MLFKRHGRNIESLRDDLARLDDAVTVISFDVFDTLVQRSVPHPDVTKMAAANYLNRLLSAGNDAPDVQQLLKLRLESESELRRQAARRGDDPECRIDEVFNAWMSRLAVNPDQHLEDLLRAELDAELSVCYPTPGMLELVSELAASGKRLIFSSDMYLREWMIQSILQHCGYESFFHAGYVSCEIGKAKYSGELYRFMLSEENVASDKLVHVGDQFRADIAGARKAGVDAFRFIDRCKEIQHAEQRQLEKMQLKNGFWSGARWTAQVMGDPAQVARAREDHFYAIGFEFIGPLLANFSHWVLNKAKLEGFTTLLIHSAGAELVGRIMENISDAKFASYRAEILYSGQTSPGKNSNVMLVGIAQSAMRNDLTLTKPLSVAEGKLLAAYCLIPTAENPPAEPGLCDFREDYLTTSGGRFGLQGPLIEKLLTTIASATIGGANQSTSESQLPKPVQAAQDGAIDFAEAYARSLAFQGTISDPNAAFFLFQLDRLLSAPNPQEQESLKWLLESDRRATPSASKSEKENSSMPCCNKTLHHFSCRHYLQLWLRSFGTTAAHSGRSGQVPSPLELFMFWLTSRLRANKRLTDGLKRILHKQVSTK